MARSPSVRAFLDTNVIFSGLLSDEGPPARLLDGLAEGKFVGVISSQVLDELTRNVARKAPGNIAALEFLLSGTALEIVEDPVAADVALWMPLLRLGDAVIIAAAITCHPEYFVTGDRHFLESSAIAEKSALAIVTPAQFLAELEIREQRAR